MVYELRLRYEHEILAKVREVESAVAEVNGLRRRISELEAAAVAKSEEVAGLSVHNAELLGKVSGLELVCDGLKRQVTNLAENCESLRSEVAGEARLRVEFAFVQYAETRRFEERSAELDARIAELNHNMDAELYPYMRTIIDRERWVIGHGFRLAMMNCAQSIDCRAVLGKVVSMAINKGSQEGLKAGIEHGKIGRSLSEFDAYDSRVGAAYVATVNEFENVSFTILAQMEAPKDSPLELLMSALTLEVMAPGYFKRGGSRDPACISHEILLSDALATSHARSEKHRKARLEVGVPSITMPFALSQGASLVVANHQVSSAANVDGTVPYFKPHDDFFDATVLDRPMDS
nr:hypothetical protein [Tanacetum cinerariifolium]